MKNRYEALLVLNTQGKDDNVKDIVDRLESEFQKEGAEIEQVQKMDKRQFSYVAGELDAGFYVNFVFHADPQLITKLRSKFKLDPEVYRQHYQRLREKTEQPAKKIVAAEKQTARTGAWPVSIKSSCSEISRATPKCATRRRAPPSRNSGLRSIAFTPAKTGEKREEVTFVDVTFWGRTAESRRRVSKKRTPGLYRGTAAARYLGRQTIRSKAEASSRSSAKRATARLAGGAAAVVADRRKAMRRLARVPAVSA